MNFIYPKLAYFIHTLRLSIPFRIRRFLFRLYPHKSLLHTSKLPLPTKVKGLIFKLFPDKLYSKQIGKNISLNLDIRSRDESYIYTKGYWEKDITTLIQQICKRGNIIFDVGANIGYYTLITAKLVGEEGMVYAFEPCPRNIRLLEDNVQRNHLKNISIERTALGEKSGTMYMYLPSYVHFGVGSFFKSRHYLIQKAVQVITLDDFIKERGITHIDFLKMDIEGGEIFALRGMKETLKQKIIRNIFIHIHSTILSRKSYKSQEIKKSLIGSGYKLYKIVANRFLPTSIDSEEGGYFLVSDSKRLSAISKKYSI